MKRWLALFATLTTVVSLQASCAKVIGLSDLSKDTDLDDASLTEAGANREAGAESDAGSVVDAGRDGGNDGGREAGIFTSDAGLDCTIGGKTYAPNAPNPTNICQSCIPDDAVTAWSNLADGAQCGMGGICDNGTCVSGCSVGDVYYMTNAADPNDPCETCQPSVSTSSYTSIADGTGCGNSQICTAGKCGVNCEIGGTLYATGSVNPNNPCQICKPGSNGTDWSTAAPGTACASGEVCSGAMCVASCFIQGTLYGANAANPANACQSCQPAMSTTAWSATRNGQGCGVGGTCSAGACVPPSSCAVTAPGVSDCGASAESCCSSPAVTGGTYFRSYPNTDPETVSGFRMDKYLVTVGRFRQFAAAVSGGYATRPGTGKQGHLNGGKGLVNSGAAAGTYENGWDGSWSANVAPTTANLTTGCSRGDWTATAGANEHLPINCVNWFEAYSFCIWDGGFLPTDGELEYVGAGGSQERAYPWGSAAPGTASQYAIYGCFFPTGTGKCNGLTNLAPVGTAPLGAALWGQLDVAGELDEWTLDFATDYQNPCTDCGSLSPGNHREARGGYYYGSAADLPPPSRYGRPAEDRNASIGFRCGRAP